MHNTETLSQPFVFDTPARYQEILSRLSDRALAVLSNKERSADDRAHLLDSIHSADATINGQAERVAEDLALMHQETEAKKEWLSWDFVKENATKTWEIAKQYKWWILGTGAVAAASYGIYTGAIPEAYVAVKTWLGAQAWAQGAMSKLGGLFEAGSVAPEAPGMPAGLPQVDPGFGVPTIPPVFPDQLPPNPVDIL